MRSFSSLATLVALVVLFGSASPVSAHDGAETTSFSDYVVQQYTHEDADPWKGWLNVNVTNNMSEAWGDFHFEILDVGWDVSNVDFIVASPYEPTSSQSGLNWALDNAAYGATIDLYFYSDPVLPGETATFSVYTDNTTDQLPFFGWAIYPTPVPEPGMLILAALGISGLMLKPRRR